MNKILYILMAVLALIAVIDCKVGVEDGTNQHDICSIIGCVNKQNIIRKKRENGESIRSQVERLVHDILNTNWIHTTKVRPQRRKKTVVVGPG